MKLTLLNSNPKATSSTSSFDKKYSLPKETKTVEFSSFVPSQSINSMSSSAASLGSTKDVIEIGWETIGGMVMRRKFGVMKEELFVELVTLATFIYQTKVWSSFLTMT
uniref:Uncharacterized protein n=1 Tax=Solanum lycopersicum TaxID=4081 RepID=A0A3Q7G9F4_SOLLC